MRANKIGNGCTSSSTTAEKKKKKKKKKKRERKECEYIYITVYLLIYMVYKMVLLIYGGEISSLLVLRRAWSLAHRASFFERRLYIVRPFERPANRGG